MNLRNLAGNRILIRFGDSCHLLGAGAAHVLRVGYAGGCLGLVCDTVAGEVLRHIYHIPFGKAGGNFRVVQAGLAHGDFAGFHVAVADKHDGILGSVLDNGGIRHRNHGIGRGPLKDKLYVIAHLYGIRKIRFEVGIVFVAGAL